MIPECQFVSLLTQEHIHILSILDKIVISQSKYSIEHNNSFSLSPTERGKIHTHQLHHVFIKKDKTLLPQEICHFSKIVYNKATLFSRRLILSLFTHESNYDYLIMALSLNYNSKGEDSTNNRCTYLLPVHKISPFSLTDYGPPNCLLATSTKFLTLQSPNNICNNLSLI